MTCDEARDLLGEYLTGGLDPGMAAEVGVHLEVCAACQGVVSELRRLEGVLRGLGAPAARVVHRRRWPWVAAAAAVIAVALIPAAVSFLSSFRTPAQVGTVVSGELVDGGAPFRAGSRIPCSRELLASAPAVLRIDGDAEIRLRAGSRIDFASAQEAALRQGAAQFEVGPGHGLLCVETPRGSAEARDSRFDLKVEETQMSRNTVIGGAAVLVTMTVVGGMVLFKPGGKAEEEVRVPAGHEIVATGDEVLTRPISVADNPEILALRAEVEKLKKELEEARAEAARFKGAAESADARARELDQKLGAEVETRGATLARALASIDDLKKRGLGGFLTPGATSQLVSDVKSLGSEGLELVMGLLRSDDPNARFLAAKLLEDLSDPQSVGVLRDAALNDEDEMVANMSSHALALMEDRAALEPLRELVKKTEREGVKVNAMYGLLKHGDPEGYQLATDYLKNEENPVRLRAAIAPGIFLLTDPKTLPIADLCVQQFAKNDWLMDMAVNYCKNLNSPEGRLRLKTMADDPKFSEAIRKAAASALGY